MSTSNPNIYLPKCLDGVNFNTKEINGVNYRTNHFNYKDLNIRINPNSINNKNQSLGKNKIITRDQRTINLDKIRNILSDDDKTSEDEYSDNFSFDEDENESQLNNNKNNNYNNNNYNNNYNSKNTESHISNIDLHDPDIILAAKDLNKNSTNLTNQNWTHFFAIPFNKHSQNQDLVEKFSYFRNKIIEEELIEVNESLFQAPERLHMTLCLLELKSNNEISNVKKILKEKIQPEINEFVKGNAMYSFFESFEVFGKPHESRVLYAKPKNAESDKLFDVLDILFSNLVENKILNKDALQYSNIKVNEKTDRFEKDKLHMTIMNSTFAVRDNLKNNGNVGSIVTIQDLLNGGSNKKKENCFFNGMKIIRRFNNFHFGSHKVNEICLYEMKIDSDTNTYKIVESIKFNN
jgi:activating signal cointegrator complex subunit 1